MNHIIMQISSLVCSQILRDLLDCNFMIAYLRHCNPLPASGIFLSTALPSCIPCLTSLQTVLITTYSAGDQAQIGPIGWRPVWQSVLTLWPCSMDSSPHHRIPAFRKMYQDLPVGETTPYLLWLRPNKYLNRIRNSWAVGRTKKAKTVLKNQVSIKTFCWMHSPFQT